MQTTRANLTGKTAVVTGASKGIGAAIARRLAADGAAVVVNYSSSRDGADRVVSDITAAGGKAVAVQADLSKSADIARLFDEADKAFGRLDILVNNAGVYAFQPIEDVTPDEYRRQFDLNVLGLLLASQQAAKRFTAGGNIINISSIASRAALPGAAVYAGAKAAVDAITRSLATELGPRNIRVNAINPGMVDTEGIRTAGIYESEFHKHVESQTPLGRIGQPDDVASLSSFLASDESSWMTGEIFYLSGGFRG